MLPQFAGGLPCRCPATNIAGAGIDTLTQQVVDTTSRVQPRAAHMHRRGGAGRDQSDSQWSGAARQSTAVPSRPAFPDAGRALDSKGQLVESRRHGENHPGHCRPRTNRRLRPSSRDGRRRWHDPNGLLNFPHDPHSKRKPQSFDPDPSDATCLPDRRRSIGIRGHWKILSEIGVSRRYSPVYLYAQTRRVGD